MNEEELAPYHAQWVIADGEPGYPCRVSLKDAAEGERVLSFTHLHHDCHSPYRASGPIFVRENSETAQLEIGELPVMLRHRLLSVRGYSQLGNMIGAEVVAGTEVESALKKLFNCPEVEYLHIHNALPGCFDCAVYRA